MPEPQVPQLTDLGERLAKDDERKQLESLLERLPKEADCGPAGKPGEGSRVEAVKSARHILQSVWSMQHMDKLAKKP